jgi:hypothetical protein
LNVSEVDDKEDECDSRLKKPHPVGLSNTALDTIVQCYVGQACPTGLSDMGLDNSVQCHVKQTWFDGFV